jgi:hypothetical protein
MNAVIIGISSGFLIILIIVFLKQYRSKVNLRTDTFRDRVSLCWFCVGRFTGYSDKCKPSYHLLFLGYYGVKNIYSLAAGYFLHGCWDAFYGFF